MGYNTGFRGEFVLDKPLSQLHKKYLTKFSRIRHVKRNTELMQDGLHNSVGLPLGVDGAYCVEHLGYGHKYDSSILDYANPPQEHPGLWCQWTPNDEGTVIEWDGREKFYNYIDWIKYLIKHFLAPWGYTLNGKVEWRGSTWDDAGVIIINDNEVAVENA